MDKIVTDEDLKYLKGCEIEYEKLKRKILKHLPEWNISRDEYEDVRRYIELDDIIN